MRAGTLSTDTSPGSGRFVGRDAELSRLTALTRPDAVRPALVLGPWGSGKSTVLHAVAQSARARGIEVAQVSAAPAQADRHPHTVTSLAPLSALLDQVRACSDPPLSKESIEHLPPASAGVAVTRVLARAAARAPAGLLVLVDDADQLDPDCAQALAVACRRLAFLRAGVVLASTSRSLASDMDIEADEVLLEPLTEHDAHLLLERCTDLGRGGLRRTVVAQAQGNPLALTDYARAAADGAWDRQAHWPARRPLPCTPETTARVRRELEPLDPGTRLALLLAASTSPDELAVLVAADPRGLSPAVWRGGEDAGLVATTPRGARFTHPLIRSAVYHLASAHERSRVHREIAGALAGFPDLRAWHLAEGADGRTDPCTARLLERSIGEALERGGPEAAATALDQAAGLVDAEEEAARLLVRAADYVSTTGDTAWERALITRTRSLSHDRDVLDAAVVRIGWSQIWTGSYEDALLLLLPLAGERAPHDRRYVSLALRGVVLAASYLGTARPRAQARLAVTTASSAHTDADTLPPDLLLALVIDGPHTDRARRTARLRALLSVPPGEPGTDAPVGPDPLVTGTVAWMLDESESAVELLGRAVEGSGGQAGRGSSGSAAAALAWACLETGRWRWARELAERLMTTEMLAVPDVALVAAQTVLAVLAAHQGRPEEAALRAAAAERTARSWSDRAATAKALHAAALAALSTGDDETAYRLLHEILEGPDGVALHPHYSPYAVADFAQAALRTGRYAQARDVLAHTVAGIEGTPSPRLEFLIRHAGAMLDDDHQEAERGFRAALAPDSSQWPIEQATSMLHYAEWLRRHHRERESIPLLISARRAFELVDAHAALRRVNAELGAARRARATTRESEHGDAARREAWAQLSAQQQRILRLAAAGRSNREIAAELTLSARTVGGHLYRAFPVLGISSRQQIHEVIPGPVDAPEQSAT